MLIGNLGDISEMQVAVGAPDRPEKGEDWEHEEEIQDDDLEQGEEEGLDHDLNITTKKCDPCAFLLDPSSVTSFSA